MISILSSLRLRDIEDILWKTALRSAGTVKIRSACERSLRAWIVIAVQRMERQHRFGPEDVSIAEDSVTKLVDLLKREAVLLGKVSHLDYATFQAARRRLREQGALIPVTLWPFWPHQFDLNTKPSLGRYPRSAFRVDPSKPRPRSRCRSVRREMPSQRAACT